MSKKQNETVWCEFRGLLNDAKECTEYLGGERISSENPDRFCQLCLIGQVANELQDIADKLTKIEKKI